MLKTDKLNMNPPALVSLLVFLLIFTVVQLMYVGVVRPAAEAAIAAQGSAAATNFWVILKDIEQQICVSVALYCIFLIAYKWFILRRDEPLYTRNFLVDRDKKPVGTLKQVLQRLESSELRDNGALATWINCIRRYLNTHNVQHAADAIKESVESLASQLEAGNSMIRYFIWAIPSIGFVGTVRGIGSALGKAEQAVAGDISGMVDKLGVAFNSTLVSLLFSLLLMLLLHILNNRQDQMILKTQKTCEENLLSHLHESPAH